MPSIASWRHHCHHISVHATHRICKASLPIISASMPCIASGGIIAIISGPIADMHSGARRHCHHISIHALHRFGRHHCDIIFAPTISDLHRFRRQHRVGTPSPTSRREALPPSYQHPCPASHQRHHCHHFRTHRRHH